MKIIASTIGGLILAAAIAVGGWQLHWWAANSAANHSAVITQNGLAAQSAYVQEARNGISQVGTINVQINAPSTPSSEITSLRAQLAAVTTQTCAIAQDITSSVPNDIAVFISTNC